jgi:HK97 gp10 family phage protein
MTKEFSSVKVKGISDLLKNIEEFPKEVYAQCQDEVQKAAQMVLNAAMSKAPVKTGNLKAHFRVHMEGDLSRQSVGATVENTANHAHLIEYGHIMTTNNLGRGKGRFIKVVPAKPFIRPALEGNSQEVIDKMVNGVNSALANMESKAK